MDAELTSRQQHFLDYLTRKITRTGRTPSLRQAAVDLSVSHAAVAQMLKVLAEKGYVRREGRYSRTIHLLNRRQETAALQRWREVPVVGRIAAGLPLYAQQEWGGGIVVDTALFRGENLFSLKVTGDSMTGVGILDGDMAICAPRQYAENGEIVVALINGEDATVKRFFRRKDHITLRPENPDYAVMRYGFGEVLVQGKVIGIQRGIEEMERL
ncbi:MAG: repressor LexA [Deltaproteobacteria bacterium]|nr:MAG: repressor LexA [Deltaproteobacteria bacterium]